MTSRTLKFAAAFAVVVLATARPAAADLTRTGSPLLVGAPVAGEGHADVAYDNKNGYYLVAWGDGGTGSVRPAWAQLINAGGAAVGPALQLTNCAGELYGGFPKVAYSTGSTDDVFVVFYREWCGGAITDYVQALKSTAAGVVAVGSRLAVAAGTSMPGGVAYNPQKGEFFGVWESYSTVTDYDVQGRAFPLSRSGATVTGVAPLPPTLPIYVAAGTQGWPDIAYAPDSQSYLIVMHVCSTSNVFSIVAFTMEANAYTLSLPLTLNSGGYQVQPSVVYLPQPQQFLVSWRSGDDQVARKVTPMSGVMASAIYPVIALPGPDGGAGIGYDSLSGVGLVADMQNDYWSWGSSFDENGSVATLFRASSVAPTIPGGGTFFPQVTGTTTGTIALTYVVDYAKAYFERFTATTIVGLPPPPPPGVPPPPPPGTCVYSLSQTTWGVSPYGGSGMISVNTNTTGCSWTATSNAAWLTVSGSGSSSGSVSVTAAANPSFTAGRTAIATIAGQKVTVVQGSRHRTSTDGMTDFDGDGKADLAVFRPSNGVWYVRLSSTGNTATVKWGASTDRPVPGDYDGDGKTDVAMYRPSTGMWYIILSSNSSVRQVKWGGDPSDIPVPGDFDGDGITDVAVYRKSQGLWYIIYSSTGAQTWINWGGLAEDIPLVGDFDGDGRAELTIFRPSSGYWYVYNLRTQSILWAQWGMSASDIPILADFDGDGKADLTIYQPSTGGWWVYPSSTHTGVFYQWGNSPTNIPTPADYTGDGITDLGVFAPGFYTLSPKTQTPFYYNFGVAGDIPVTK